MSPCSRAQGARHACARGRAARCGCERTGAIDVKSSSWCMLLTLSMLKSAIAAPATCGRAARSTHTQSARGAGTHAQTPARRHQTATRAAQRTKRGQPHAGTATAAPQSPRVCGPACPASRQPTAHGAVPACGCPRWWSASSADVGQQAGPRDRRAARRRRPPHVVVSRTPRIAHRVPLGRRTVAPPRPPSAVLRPRSPFFSSRGQFFFSWPTSCF